MPRKSKKGGAVALEDIMSLSRRVPINKNPEEIPNLRGLIRNLDQRKEGVVRAKIRIIDVIAKHQALSVIKQLIMLSNMKKELERENITFFSPTNAAMNTHPELDVLLKKDKSENEQLMLDQFIKAHVVKGLHNLHNKPHEVEHKLNKKHSALKEKDTGNIKILHNGEPVAKIVKENLKTPSGEPHKAKIHMIDGHLGEKKDIADNVKDTISDVRKKTEAGLKNVQEEINDARKALTDNIPKGGVGGLLKTITGLVTGNTTTPKKGPTSSETASPAPAPSQAGGTRRRKRRKTRRKSAKKSKKRRRRKRKTRKN